MKNLMKILTTAFIILNLSSFAQPQTIQGYSFDKYPAKVSNAPKAKLNLSSHELGKTFRTMITQGYKNAKVGFGGYYVMIQIGCGSGCARYVMVDIRDGKIYEVLDEALSGMGCSSYNEDFVNNKPNSRLFMSVSCSESEIENTSNANQEFIYTILIWNETTKKFSAPKEIKMNQIVKADN